MEGWGRVPQALPGHTVPPPLPQDNPQLGDPVSSSRARWPIPDSGAGFESRGGAAAPVSHRPHRCHWSPRLEVLNRDKNPVRRREDHDHPRHAHEDTYARWLKRTDDQLRAAFDAYDVKALG